MTHIVLIDYGSGNLRSAAKAFERVADGNAHVVVTADPAALDSATHIVLPGVGAFGDCIAGLRSIPGMIDALEKNVRERGKPFLGICVGMQMLFEEGHEHGVHKGLGWIGGKVVKLRDQASGLRHQSDSSLMPEAQCLTPPLKIPHMGWNTLRAARTHPLLENLPADPHAYFVHSYHANPADPADILATTDYGGAVVAAVARGNIMGTQFHPEKSQELGLQLLRNFLLISYAF